MSKKEYSGISEILDELILSNHSINEIVTDIGDPGENNKLATEKAIRSLYNDLNGINIYKVKVDSLDNVAGFLSEKIETGIGISFAINSTEDDHKIIITNTITSFLNLDDSPLSYPTGDKLVFFDDSAGNLEWLSLGSGLSISNQTLNVNQIGIDTNKVATDVTDAVPGVLVDKIINGLGISISVNSDTSDHKLVITNTVWNIEDLNDVILTNPIDDQILQLSGGDWINVNIPTNWENHWDRDSGNGYVYLSTLTDRVGVGTITPSSLLHIYSTSFGVATGLTFNSGSSLIYESVDGTLEYTTTTANFNVTDAKIDGNLEVVGSFGLSNYSIIKVGEIENILTDSTIKIPTSHAVWAALSAITHYTGWFLRADLDLENVASADEVEFIGGTNISITKIKATNKQTLIFDSTGGGSSLWTEDIINNYVYPTTTSYGINLAKTTNANQDGVIYKNGNRFIYEFSYGLNTVGITPYGNNLFIGENAGNFSIGITANNPTKGSYNLGIGYNILGGLVDGYDITAIGSNSLTSVIPDGSNLVVIGSNLINPLASSIFVGDAVVIGSNMPFTNATVLGSMVFIGTDIGTSLISGSNNIVIGKTLFKAATTASQNVIIGTSVADVIYDQNFSVFIGYYAGHNNNASYSTAVGHSALQTATGVSNAVFGYRAGNNISDGKQNVYFGGNAGQSARSSDSNVGIGYQALGYGTMNNCNYNIGIGFKSLGDLADNLNYNIGIGSAAGFRSVGGYNVFIGEKAAGYGSAHPNQRNVVLGAYAGYKMGNASFSFIGGYQAGYFVSGDHNLFIGNMAGYKISTGAYNIFMGYKSAFNDGTGAYPLTNYNSILIGRETKPALDGDYNEIAIGAFVVGNGSNTVTTGNSSITDNYLNGKLHITSSIQVADDTDAASVANVGAMRYKVTSNDSYVEMCMQTGVSTYAWVVIKTNTW